MLVLSGTFGFSLNDVSAGCSSVTCRENSCAGNEISIPACKAEKCDPYGGARPFPCALTSEVEQCGSVTTFGAQCKNSLSECASGTSSDTACAGKFCPTGKIFCKSASTTCEKSLCQSSACDTTTQVENKTCGNQICSSGEHYCEVLVGGTCALASNCQSAACASGQEDLSCSAQCPTDKPHYCKSTGNSDGGTTAMCTGSENPGIVPCGRSCDNPATPNDETKICTLCHLLILIQNITNWIFMVMTYIAFAVLVAMGILYIVSTGKPQLTGMAKNGIWAALVGFAIVLLGWVAINVILMVLADGALGTDTASFAVKTNGSWFEYKCDTQTKYTGAGGTGGGSGGGSGGGGGGGNGPGNGSCSVITSGYCTTENLGKACTWNAEAASKVCNVESGGNTAAASNTDRCQNESGDRFSFGLFQLNIIANGCMLGNDCCWQNVFSLENGSAGNNGGAKKRCTNSKGITYVCGWGCTVINRAKYTECSQRAMDAAKNISAACTLYKQSGWGPWPVTKKRCGL